MAAFKGNATVMLRARVTVRVRVGIGWNACDMVVGCVAIPKCYGWLVLDPLRWPETKPEPEPGPKPEPKPKREPGPKPGPKPGCS